MSAIIHFQTYFPVSVNHGRFSALSAHGTSMNCQASLNIMRHAH